MNNQSCSELSIAIGLLQSIDATLKELLALSKSKRVAASSAANVANDADLDSQYGDEKIKTKPRDWTGDFVGGQTMSESDPAMLDLLAERFDYFAGKEETEGATTSTGKPKAPYSRTSAKRARGWAARLRAGWKPKPTPHVSASEVKW